MNDLKEEIAMGEYSWTYGSTTVFSSEAGRQAYRDDEFDWFEDVCDQYDAEPEFYED